MVRKVGMLKKVEKKMHLIKAPVATRAGGKQKQAQKKKQQEMEMETN